MVLTDETISLMQELRQKLRLEFGINFKLTDPDIFSHLREYAGRTMDSRCKLIYAELADILRLDQNPSDSTYDNTRIYRGQIISQEQVDRVEQKSQSKKIYRGRVVENDDKPSLASGKKQRIYRGRVVSDSE